MSPQLIWMTLYGWATYTCSQLTDFRTNRVTIRAGKSPLNRKCLQNSEARVGAANDLHSARAIMSIDFPREEEAVLKRWKEIKAFERQVELSKGKRPYTFYDGPPFATGLPHHGHLLASTIKDIIPRYWSMKGHYVERRFGWDTHGLPIEHEIDKKLGVSGKAAVMEMGIAKYNAECRAIVMRYASEWRQTIDRLGRWIDFENDYKVCQVANGGKAMYS